MQNVKFYILHFTFLIFNVLPNWKRDCRAENRLARQIRVVPRVKLASEGAGFLFLGKDQQQEQQEDARYGSDDQRAKKDGRKQRNRLQFFQQRFLFDGKRRRRRNLRRWRKAVAVGKRHHRHSNRVLAVNVRAVTGSPVAVCWRWRRIEAIRLARRAGE